MIHIKRFIDKVSVLESRQSKDLIIPISEARGLRDELAKLLADLHTSQTTKKDAEEPVIQLELKGGTF